MRPSLPLSLLLLAVVLGGRALLRRAGWPRGRALAGGVAGSYGLTAASLFLLDPADLPQGGRAAAAAVWAGLHLILFLALWPFLGRAPRARPFLPTETIPPTGAPPCPSAPTSNPS